MTKGRSTATEQGKQPDEFLSNLILLTYRTSSKNKKLAGMPGLLIEERYGFSYRQPGCHCSDHRTLDPMALRHQFSLVLPFSVVNESDYSRFIIPYGAAKLALQICNADKIPPELH
jgi:hypothetical protein